MPIPLLDHHALANHCVDAELGVELLAAVVAEPDDVNRRLVYADWLMAHGDAQGELIQLCERRRASSDARLDARIQELERAYGQRIADEITQLAGEYTLERGFVARLKMAASTFDKHGERLLERSPIEHLELDPINAKTLARLARAPALRGIRSLRIVGRRRRFPFDDLCGSPHLEALRRLEVVFWYTEGQPQAAFAKLAAPRLERLVLSEVDRSGKILDGLARNESVRLRDLVISDRARSNWSPALSARAYERLRTLSLDTHGPEVGRLLEGASLPELCSLELGRGFPLELLRFPNLRRLSLDAVAYEPGWLPELVAGLPRLELLRVWRLEGDELNATLEAALQLPSDIPLAGLRLPMRGDPELLDLVAQRFGRDYDDFEQVTVA
jgi:uncharacterized protein (TIGR02996 family)